MMITSHPRYVVNLRRKVVHLRDSLGRDFPQCNLDDIVSRRAYPTLDAVREDIGEPVRCKRCFPQAESVGVGDFQ